LSGIDSWKTSAFIISKSPIESTPWLIPFAAIIIIIASEIEKIPCCPGFKNPRLLAVKIAGFSYFLNN
jgi:hypothetical protein